MGWSGSRPMDVHQPPRNPLHLTAQQLFIRNKCQPRILVIIVFPFFLPAGMPGWEIALITIASLLGFGILVAIIGSLCNKKKKRRGRQQTANPTDAVYSVSNNVLSTTTVQQHTYPAPNVVQPYPPPQGTYPSAPPSYCEVAAAPYPNPTAAPYPNPTAAPYPNPTAAPYPNPAAAYPPPSTNQVAADPSAQQNGDTKVVPTI